MNEIKHDSVIKNLSYQIIYQILSIILPLVTTPYISRVLGQVGVGIYSYTNSIVYFFVIFANLGISNYGNREIASVEGDKNKLTKTFWSIFVCHFFVTLICIFAYFLFVLKFITEYRIAFICQIFQLVGALFDITWFFTGIQKFKVTVIKNAIIKVIMLLFTFLLVRNADDVWIYILVLSVGNLIGQLSVWLQLKKYVGFCKLSFKSIFKHLKPLLLLFVPIIAISIYRYMDKIMISNFSSINELGLYENSEKIITIPQSVITAIGLVLLPRITNLITQEKCSKATAVATISLKYSLILAFGMTFGLIAVSKTFAPIFFGDDFSSCSELIALLSSAIVFLTISNTLRSNYLIPNKKDMVFILAAFSGAILNFVLNILLIPRYGAKGAVIATLLTECLVACIHILFSFRALKLGKLFLNTFLFLAPSFAMLGIVNRISEFYGQTLFSLVAQVFVGAIFYIVMVFVLLISSKDTMVLSFFEKLKKKKWEKKHE